MCYMFENLTDLVKQLQLFTWALLCFYTSDSHTHTHICTHAQVNFILVRDDGFPWLRKDFERFKSVDALLNAVTCRYVTTGCNKENGNYTSKGM